MLQVCSSSAKGELAMTLSNLAFAASASSPRPSAARIPSTLAAHSSPSAYLKAAARTGRRCSWTEIPTDLVRKGSAFLRSVSFAEYSFRGISRSRTGMERKSGSGVSSLRTRKREDWSTFTSGRFARASWTSSAMTARGSDS